MRARGTLLGLVLCTTSWAAPDAGTVSAPVELRRAMPFVQVMVNGRGPFTFGIDTGTGTEALVAPALAEALSLPAAGTVEAGDPSGKNPRQLRQVKVATLSVAGVDFTGITAAVYAPSQAEGPCDGILGFPLFRDRLLTIDYPGSRLLLGEGSLSRSTDGTTVPFRAADGVPVVDLAVGDKTVPAVVDSRGSGLALPAAIAPRLKMSGEPVVIGRGRTISGEFEVRGVGPAPPTTPRGDRRRSVTARTRRRPPQIGCAAVPAPSAEARRIRGEYFTPPPLVEAVLALAMPHVGGRPLTVVDPACGDGAFLAAAARALPRARLHGLELDPAHAAAARRSAPGARVLAADALRGGWDDLVRTLPDDGEELWLGNPPYNGTSPLLRDPPAYRALRARLALDDALPPGTSLRDDYVFFLLLASERLVARPGVLAWVTSATLLDAFLYAPLRRRLLDSCALREVVDLGPGVFPGTRVRTCITVWRSRRGPAPSPRFRTWAPSAGPVERAPARPLAIDGPEWSLRPVPADAARLDALWRATGEPLDVLVPVSCTGLKTRFDELLVDDDADRLLARVDAFLRARDLGRFAREHGIPSRLVPKLRALRRAPALPSRADDTALRPFHRWAGARHRAGLPDDSRAFCYLDRRLIPRGDHRLVGAFDPHAGDCKLVFNVRELPLAATVLEAPGCVPAHRHTRFAPLLVPGRVRTEGPAAGRSGIPLGPLVPNLSPTGLAWAERVGGPREAFRHIAAFLNSPEVQDIWAPAFGCSRVVPVPLASAPSRG